MRCASWRSFSSSWRWRHSCCARRRVSSSCCSASAKASAEPHEDSIRTSRNVDVRSKARTRPGRGSTTVRSTVRSTELQWNWWEIEVNGWEMSGLSWFLTFCRWLWRNNPWLLARWLITMTYVGQRCALNGIVVWPRLNVNGKSVRHLEFYETTHISDMFRDELSNKDEGNLFAQGWWCDGVTKQQEVESTQVRAHDR